MVLTLLDRALATIAPPACFGCGASAGSAAPLCVACRSGLGWLSPDTVMLEAEGELGLEAWAPLAYRGGARALARALKFRGAVALADGMAAPIVAGAPPALLSDGTVVPVPLHPARRRRRGFNQAERLGRALGARAGLPVLDCLERRGARGTQMGRDRDQRLVALTGAIGVRRGAAVPRHAVLVDDVLTTGATLLACASVLRRAGAQSVVAVAYARTPGR